MKYYRISDLTVGINCFGERLGEQAKPYLIDGYDREKDGLDMTVSLELDNLLERQRENPHLTLTDCEYMWTGFVFYRKLIAFDGIMLHASAVEVDGNAYLFSAPSGTGKSTHTALWVKYFGEDRAKIINDDKPAIRIVDGEIYAYGTPWSGKTDQNLNRRAKVKGICFLERGEQNRIAEIATSESLYLLMNQTIRPRDPEFMSNALKVIDKILTRVPAYKMCCNMDVEAARIAYETMSR